MNSNRRLALAFLLFIFTICALGFMIPDRSFSPRENRYLAQFPRFSLTEVLSGKFMAALERFADDQFPGRDAWVFLKTDIERLFGKRENNGIYFGADGYLLASFQADPAWLRKNVAEINAFARQIGLPVSLLLAPSASTIYSEKLPANAPSGDQMADWLAILAGLEPEIHAADVISALLAAKDESIFFRTDHHWTMRGAYFAYATWMQSRGEQPLPLESFQSQVISDSFWGTHYSKANLRSVMPDQIELLQPAQPPSVTVHYPGEGLTLDSFYQPQYLDGRDQYAYFLGGNYPLVQIKTDAGNGRRILLIKDSYSHVFVPYLAAHYEEIHLIDLRYYAASTRDYIAEQGIDEVLFLYSLQQFGSNSSLAKLGV